MTRILFVDDEPRVLDNLRRMLRAYRREWTMEFCQRPELALAMMADVPFDVVVADMQMPGMDGAEFLTRVRELYPDTVRIVLSNPSQQEGVLRAVGPAHQYLAKPCDPEFLYSTIQRARLLNARLTNPELKSLVSHMDTLPSLPDIYFELVEELQDPDASVDRVGALISRDIGMTAKVLQLVNSSFFGLSVHVEDANHAAALLGLNTLKPLVLTACIFRQLEKSRVPVAWLEKILSHSMDVAGLAKQLATAERVSREIADNAFIAGALHDVGKIVLADNFGNDYNAVCQQAEEQESSLSSVEHDRLGASHADVGGFLLGLWNLPQEMVEAVAYHHDPNTSVDRSFTPLTAVHVANALVATAPEASGDDRTAEGLDSQYLGRLHLQDRVPGWQELAAQCTALA